MEGLVKEGGEAIEVDYVGEAKVALLIGAAQRVEQISNFGRPDSKGRSDRPDLLVQKK